MHTVINNAIEARNVMITRVHALACRGKQSAITQQLAALEESFNVTEYVI